MNIKESRQLELERIIAAAAAEWFGLASNSDVDDGSAQHLSDYIWGALGEEEQRRGIA